MNHTTQTTHTTQAEQLALAAPLTLMLAPEGLHPSPFNPRRTFHGIDELAASIRAEGCVHQPLLVRPRITNPLRPDENDGYEIIFGHRRATAAEQAGLASVPCMVKPMSDEEARRVVSYERVKTPNVRANLDPTAQDKP